MLIRRDQVIVGRPAVEVREILRTLHDVPHSTRTLAEPFGLDEATARSLVSDLRAEDLIEMCDRSGPYVVTANEDATGPFPEMWSTTIAGAALAKARIGVPMPRVTAQRSLDGVLARVIEETGATSGSTGSSKSSSTAASLWMAMARSVTSTWRYGFRHASPLRSTCVSKRR
jgi:hypothetical protein